MGCKANSSKCHLIDQRGVWNPNLIKVVRRSMWILPHLDPTLHTFVYITKDGAPIFEGETLE